MNLFWIFSAALNQIAAEKKQKTKKATVTFFRMVMKNIHAKFHFPTLQGAKVISVKVNSSPKVSKELDTVL